MLAHWVYPSETPNALVSGPDVVEPRNDIARETLNACEVLQEEEDGARGVAEEALGKLDFLKRGGAAQLIPVDDWLDDGHRVACRCEDGV